jgi:hypothetical protein
MVLRELYLFLSLRRDEKNIGGHRKKRQLLENYWSKKKYIVVPDTTVL